MTGNICVLTLNFESYKLEIDVSLKVCFPKGALSYNVFLLWNMNYFQTKKYIYSEFAVLKENMHLKNVILSLLLLVESLQIAGVYHLFP